MNILLWILQTLAALLYGASGVMKVFMFEKVSQGVSSSVPCRGRLGPHWAFWSLSVLSGSWFRPPFIGIRN